MLDRLLDPDVAAPQQCDYCQGWTDPCRGEYVSSYDPKVVFCSERCAEKWESEKFHNARGDFGADESVMGYCTACGGVHE